MRVTIQCECHRTKSEDVHNRLKQYLDSEHRLHAQWLLTGATRLRYSKWLLLRGQSMEFRNFVTSDYRSLGQR